MGWRAQGAHCASVNSNESCTIAIVWLPSGKDTMYNQVWNY